MPECMQYRWGGVAELGTRITHEAKTRFLTSAIGAVFVGVISLSTPMSVLADVNEHPVTQGLKPSDQRPGVLQRYTSEGAIALGCSVVLAVITGGVALSRTRETTLSGEIKILLRRD